MTLRGHPRAGLVKTKLFEALLQSIETLAARTSVVLVFEDLQWADSASIEVIDFLTRNLHDNPVLLVATYRADEVERGGALRRLLAELGSTTASRNSSSRGSTGSKWQPCSARSSEAPPTGPWSTPS